MFGNGQGYSLADIAAATGGNNNGDSWGAGGCWWIVIIFLLCICGGWGNGWGFGGGGGNAGYQGTTTREEISYGFDMNGLENGIRGIQNGLCDGFYAQNTSLLTGFNNIGNMITSTGNSIQNTLNQGFTGIQAQMANDALVAQQCCCNTNNLITQGFSDLNYNIATQSCDTRRAITDNAREIISSQEAGVRSILDFLTQDKIATLTAENQSLKFAASQAAQNNYLVSQLAPKLPIPSYEVPNPFQAFNNSCCAGCAC